MAHQGSNSRHSGCRKLVLRELLREPRLTHSLRGIFRKLHLATFSDCRRFADPIFEMEFGEFKDKLTAREWNAECNDAVNHHLWIDDILLPYSLYSSVRSASSVSVREGTALARDNYKSLPFEALAASYLKDADWLTARTCQQGFLVRKDGIIGAIANTSDRRFAYIAAQQALNHFYFKCAASSRGTADRLIADNWQAIEMRGIFRNSGDERELFSNYWSKYRGDAIAAIAGDEIVICSPWVVTHQYSLVHWEDGEPQAITRDCTSIQILLEQLDRKLSGRQYLLLSTSGFVHYAKS
jgi:hypothetical protein